MEFFVENEAIALAVMQSLMIGLCVISDAKRVVFNNQRASRILADASHVSLTRDRRLICTSSTKAEFRLQELIERTISVDEQHIERRSSELLFLSNNGTINNELLVLVQPLNIPILKKNTKPGALVTLCYPHKIPPKVIVSQLMSMFDLTRAEGEVCRWLMLGMTGREIASLRKVSCETVKSQIRSALSKTDCKRRADLIRLLTFLSHPFYVDG